MTNKKEISIQEALTILELPLNSYSFNPNLSFDLISKQLEEFKNLISNQRKKLAFKYHPDLSKDKNEDKMKEINNTVDLINNLKIIRRIPQPINYFRFNVNTYYSQTNASTSSMFSTWA